VGLSGESANNGRARGSKAGAKQHALQGLFYLHCPWRCNSSLKYDAISLSDLVSDAFVLKLTTARCHAEDAGSKVDAIRLPLLFSSLTKVHHNAPAPLSDSEITYFSLQTSRSSYSNSMLATIHPSAHSPALTLHTYNGRELHPQIPVNLPLTLTAPEFLSLFSSPTHPNSAYTFPALQNWFARTLANFALQDDGAHPFHKHPYKMRELDVQAVDWFWRGRAGSEDKLGFMKIQARIETDAYIHDGEEKARADWLPGALFLRGGSVAVLVSCSRDVRWAELSRTDYRSARGCTRR
jgi:hypothetical protein